jgi:phospholipid/cholesterol/gamma-HCH transport system ATP-binding protein
MIQVQDVHHSFGDRQVLNGITFDVADGEIVVIMGSSGGGKTTLLKCIAGLLVPSSGDVLVNDISMRKDAERGREQLGLVFQYAALFDYMNVEENILFGAARRRKMSTQEKAALVKESLEEVGMKDTEHLMPSELSGGMRKRVGLARALALEPKILLYDEPTSGLDPVTAYAIDALIVETRDRHQATSIVVSHDVASVYRVADRIAFLDQGQLLFLGTPSEFRAASEGPIKDLVQKAHAESFA